MSKDKFRALQRLRDQSGERRNKYRQDLIDAIKSYAGEPLPKYWDDYIGISNPSLLQENFLAFTKYLSKHHYGKIVNVGIENGCYVVYWKGKTQDAICCPMFDGITVKAIRVKEGEIVY